MKFWDSSAIVPLLVQESKSTLIRSLGGEDTSFVLWWGTTVEISSALARCVREGSLRLLQAKTALSSFSLFAAAAVIIEPSQAILDRAKELVFAHALRAGDAMQLAAALEAVKGKPQGFPLVTLDDRMRLAAEQEGFKVLPESN